MVLLIFSIILFIVAIGLIVTSIVQEEPILKIVGGVAILFSIIMFIGSFVRSVPTGNTGIVTSFGKIEDGTLDAGVHFMAPYKKVIKMDNRTQKATLDMSCFSSDIQEVTVAYTINYQIDKFNAENIYRTIGIEYFDKVVQPKALEAVKSVFAKYNAEALIENRAVLAKQIEEVLISSLDGYNIQVTSTSIENIDFTDSFTNAVEAKQVAEQNKLKAKIEQDQMIIEAQAKADAAVIAAENDAKIAEIAANSAEYQGQKDAAIMSNLGKMLQTYPELIDYYRVTNWDGKLPTTSLGEGSNILFSEK